MPASSSEPLGGKRKRADEGDASGKQAKKQRSVRSEEDKEHAAPVPEPEPSKTGGRGGRGRAQRRKLQQEEERELKAKTAAGTAATTPAPAQECAVIVLDDSPLAGSNGKEGEGDQPSTRSSDRNFFTTRCTLPRSGRLTCILI